MPKRKRSSYGGVRKRRKFGSRRRVFKKRYGGRSRRTRGAYLRVKRLVVANAPLTIGPGVGTAGFWQYVQPSLDIFMRDMNAVSPVSLGGLTNLTEYTNLFDQYKLSALKYTFVPRLSNINAEAVLNLTGTSVIRKPYWCIVKDPQTQLTPTGAWSRANLNVLLEQGGKIYSADKPINIYLKPRISEQYGGGATRWVRPNWTTTDAPGASMPHRGFHLFAFNDDFDSTSFANMRWDVRVTYYLQFKNMR